MLRVEDAGKYYCLVNNKEESQDKINLNVQGEKQIALYETGGRGRRGGGHLLTMRNGFD